MATQGPGKKEIVRLIDRKQPEKSVQYHFDHCFWPETEHPNYADQQTVYEKLGRPLMDKVLRGT
jgi:hypothetical protein